MTQPTRVFIAGGGGIGRALGLLLRHEPSLPCHVVLGDLSLEAAQEAAEYASAGGSAPAAEAIAMPATGSSDELNAVLEKADAILDCLPGAQAPRMAQLARDHGCHYLNLTEYVAETNAVLEIAQGADTCFALQCGLAPGYINVLAHHLFQEAMSEWGATRAERIRMRVGALTEHATAPHYYGWTWSTVGVATEYVKPAIAVRGGNTVELPSLTEREVLLIEGQPYEEALTSGGAADLPQALAGKVVDLDYKTLRFVGHYDWVDTQLAGLADGPGKPAALLERMEAAIPHCDDDQVVIYADVEAKDARGNLRSKKAALVVPPLELAGHRLRAIQSTTAAGIAEVLHLIVLEQRRGPLLMSQIPTATFLNGPFCRLAYGEIKL
ncbi:MAG: saccharopine dehydrogenase family protein [Planctomycetota bacterium]|jgi:hypothetical protein